MENLGCYGAKSGFKKQKPWQFLNQAVIYLLPQGELSSIVVQNFLTQKLQSIRIHIGSVCNIFSCKGSHGYEGCLEPFVALGNLLRQVG